MFGKNPDAGSNDRHGHSVLHEGVTIRGEFQAQGDVRLDGALNGKLFVAQRLTVGSSGRITADVEASEIVVMGNIEGKVIAHQRLELKKGARMVGDVTTPILVVEEGVYFHGSSNMRQADARDPILSAIVSATETEVQDKRALLP